MIFKQVLKNSSFSFFSPLKYYYFGSIQKFVLPDLGEKIKEATVKKWHVKEGDLVEEFQGLAEVATDKLTATIPSSFKGKVHKIFHKEDDNCQVGELFLEIEVEESVSESTPASEKVEKPSAQINKQSEKKPEKEEKDVNEEILATPAVRNILKVNKLDITKIKGTGKNGRILMEDVNKYLENQGKEVEKKVTKEVEKESAKKTEKDVTEEILATPAVRNILKVNKLDITKIKGTGKNGRILKEDVNTYLENQGKELEKKVTMTKEVEKEAPAEKRTVKMTDFQKGMQKSMTESNTIPHFYIKEEIDLTTLNGLRAELKHDGTSVTFMPFFIKAFSMALTQYPILNSSYQASKPFEYTNFKNHNISIAVDSPKGLIVPNIKNCQGLSVLDIQNELLRLRKLAEEGKMGGNDLFDGTITISNIGNIAGTYTGPLILPPQVCIVGIGRMQALPRYVKSHSKKNPEKLEIQPRNIIYTSFGCDHRVLDGATVAKFVVLWKKYLEHPTSLLVNLK